MVRNEPANIWYICCTEENPVDTGSVRLGYQALPRAGIRYFGKSVMIKQKRSTWLNRRSNLDETADLPKQRIQPDGMLARGHQIVKRRLLPVDPGLIQNFFQRSGGHIAIIE
jgi:hypothetical protein